jgi:hypothetical protein
LRAGARFAITQVINYRGISPGISGYTTTLSRLFRGSQRLSASNPRIPAPISAQLATHRSGCLPSALTPFRHSPAAFPAPSRAARQPPRAPALTWPDTLAAPDGHGDEDGDGGQGLSLYGYRATDRRPRINVRHTCPRATDDCFKSYALISVWESTGGFNLAVSCTSVAERGFRCRQEYALAGRLADGADRRQVRVSG